MGGACNTYEGAERCLQGFGGETCVCNVMYIYIYIYMYMYIYTYICIYVMLIFLHEIS